jgi:hypothetical protein
LRIRHANLVIGEHAHTPANDELNTRADADDALIDWRLTTFEGPRSEQLRRWAALPLEKIIRALEEMRKSPHSCTQNTTMQHHMLERQFKCSEPYCSGQSEVGI